MKIYVLLLFVLCSFACRDGHTYGLKGCLKLSDGQRFGDLELHTCDTVYHVLPDSAGHFIVGLTAQASPFVRLVGTVESENRWQFSTPLYFKTGKELELGMEVLANQVDFSVEDKDNKALQRFRVFDMNQRKLFWVNTPEPDMLMDALQEYREMAHQIISDFRPSDEVAAYIISWANIEMIAMASNIPFIYQRHKEWKIPENLKEILPSIPESCDVPYWKMFYNCPLNISLYLKSRSQEPEEQLKILKQEFHVPDLCKEMTLRIVENFLGDFAYSDDNYARLEKLSEGLQGRQEMLQVYKNKRYAIPGAPAPDVIFEDRDGNEHRLSEFRDKYIYLDIWASWCGPCRAEVPYLQQLESELNRQDVVFVSISLDNGREAWLKMLDRLNMHGHQWRVLDTGFADMLNVKGIPHFLIYDRQGNMREYKAWRPSDSRLKKHLEKLP